MRALARRLKRLWNTPVEFYGIDRPEPQAGSWHGLFLFVILLIILGLLWLIRYLPERTYLVQLHSMSPQGCTAAGELGGGQGSAGTVASRPTCPRTTWEDIASTFAIAPSDHIALG